MNVAIVGCGAMGEIHVQMAQQSGFNVVACGDVDVSAARAVANQYGGVAGKDCLALIERNDVDVVVVTTPTPSHGEYVVAAAKAGKHVFCETPLARTVKEAEMASNAAKKSGVKLFVGHAMRYFPEIEAMKARMAAGSIGDPGFIRSHRSEVIPEGVKAWYRDYTQSGGAAFDMLVHDYDWVQGLFGPVARVFCQHLQREKPLPLDYALVTLTLESGVIVQLIGSWAAAEGFRTRIELCGTGGMIQFDSADQPLSYTRRRVGDRSAPVVWESPLAKSPYRLEWEDFRAWLEGDESPRVLPEDAVAAVRVAEAALKSAATGRAVRV